MSIIMKSHDKDKNIQPENVIFISLREITNNTSRMPSRIFTNEVLRLRLKMTASTVMSC